jgi:hypothetical protein
MHKKLNNRLGYCPPAPHAPHTKANTQPLPWLMTALQTDVQRTAREQKQRTDSGILKTQQVHELVQGRATLVPCDADGQ